MQDILYKFFVNFLTLLVLFTNKQQIAYFRKGYKMAVDLTKVAQNTGLNAIVQKAGAQNPAAAKINFNTGILPADTVDFSKAVKKARFPFTDKTTQVPEHHNICGRNCDIRYALKRLEQGKELDRCDKSALNAVQKFDADFEKLPPLEDDFTFYRGRAEDPVIKRFNEDFDIINAANAGDIIVPDRAYSYGAFKKDLAQHWSNGFGRNMMFEIRTPKGAKVSRNLEHGGEVIFPRGAEYRLISKEKDSRGILNVVLEYILPEK